MIAVESIWAARPGLGAKWYSEEEFVRRLVIVLATVTALFVIANVMNFSRAVTCWDCFFPYGVPFTLYQRGGMGGGAGIVWWGLTADLACVVVVSSLCAWLWKTISRRH